MVEAPGTAPGSALLISQYVYRYSQQKLTSPLYRETVFFESFLHLRYPSSGIAVIVLLVSVQDKPYQRIRVFYASIS